MNNVEDKIAAYPDHVRPSAERLRRWIIEAAQSSGQAAPEQSLKWGEPAFSTRQGSPVRFDWKAKQPDTISLYFNCQTSLADTFRELYGEQLDIQGNRELRLPLQGEWPDAVIRHCLQMAVNYKSWRKLPLLGQVPVTATSKL
ncbi:MAG: DUF1801 domain-containing protein [Pseudomonadales bacterium]|nr:DUF1801 domain-containing protein [Pseudomonadales bacterium]